MVPQWFPENLWQRHAHKETVDQGGAVLLGTLTEEVIQHFATWVRVVGETERLFRVQTHSQKKSHVQL